MSPRVTDVLAYRALALAEQPWPGVFEWKLLDHCWLYCGSPYGGVGWFIGDRANMAFDAADDISRDLAAIILRGLLAPVLLSEFVAWVKASWNSELVDDDGEQAPVDWCDWENEVLRKITELGVLDRKSEPERSNLT
jgi:hypothetical protein